MGSLDDLALAVKYYESLNPQAEIAKEDPYAPFANISDQVAGTLLQNPDKFSTRDILLGSFASGLLGGGLNYLSKDYQSDLTADYLDTLERSKAGAPISYSDSRLPKGLFSKANTMGSLFRSIKKEELVDSVRKAQLENARERAGKLLELGYEEDGDGNLVQVIDIAKLKAQEAGAVKRAEKAGELEASGAGGSNPFTKAVNKYGDEVLARDFVKTTDPDFLAAKQSIEKGGSPQQTLQFVEKQFDDAKQLNSLMALIPGTGAANDMAGIQTNLRTKIQQALGREMNGPEQEKLLQALPDWNDSVAQIEAKKSRFKDLVQNLITPSVTSVGSQSSGGISQAEALAELKRRGLVK